ncbi:unnamed protein product [Cyprideis torosa]|uniref:Uncharacterized protein n=1 Tax=Cyprideis torosa TaxID=163714 RepID=A0A7R8WYF7_9CRUS|nr:unnamed protein product [Cyprideis torosa]CAG0909652.1 unnamed protein product [Cyprideis torosa]
MLQSSAPASRSASIEISEAQEQLEEALTRNAHLSHLVDALRSQLRTRGGVTHPTPPPNYKNR